MTLEWLAITSLGFIMFVQWIVVGLLCWRLGKAEQIITALTDPDEWARMLDELEAERQFRLEQRQKRRQRQSSITDVRIEEENYDHETPARPR